MSISTNMSIHYELGFEKDRLQRSSGLLEKLRTCDLMKRCLPSAPARILDVGGGPGTYTEWLLERGYETCLLDPMPLHVEQAQAVIAASAHPDRGLAAIGDARHLPEKNESADGVLMLGPLYHLIERADRMQALQEAWRVLKPGGILLAAAVSRFASVLDGFEEHLLDDPVFVEIVEADLRSGQHRNPANHPAYFTTAFFHHPHELKSEVQEAGFQCRSLVGIEGPVWLMGNRQEHLDDPDRRERLLYFLRKIEEEPTLIGASAHLVAVGSKS